MDSNALHFLNKMFLKTDMVLNVIIIITISFFKVGKLQSSSDKFAGTHLYLAAVPKKVSFFEVDIITFD